MPVQSRLIRTYSRRGGHLRALPMPSRWISPAQNRERLFSSTSACSSTASAGSSTLSTPSDDPDFLPRNKRYRQPLGKRPARPWCLRTRRARAADKENRPPDGPRPVSPSPSPPAARSRRKGLPAGAQLPLLCSTPHCNTPQWPPQRRSRVPAADLSPVLLSTSREGSGQGESPRLRFPRRRLSSVLPSSVLSSPGSLRRDTDPLLTGDSEGEEKAGRAFPEAPGSGELGPVLRRSGRVLRSSVRGSCRAPAPLSSQTSLPVLPPGKQGAQHSGAASDEPCEAPKGESTNGNQRCQKGKTSKHQLTPVVLLDSREMLTWLMSSQLRKNADVQPACQEPESPLAGQGVLGNTYTSAVALPGGGSTCRKACISGFSASRWGRQMRLRPKRNKNKRWQQQPNNCLFRSQRRQKRMKTVALESSIDIGDNDCSILSSSHNWGRVRASLSFHKKKKVTTEESFYNSIFCTPSTNSRLSGHQGTPSAQHSAQFASSMVMLASSSLCSGLEPMLTDAEKVFGECQQEGPITFEECIPLDKMKDCKKIGEGVFGEVFQIASERGPVALKIIPIEGSERVNGEAQKTFGEILPEIIISKELSLLSEESVNRTVGFITLYSVHCVKGAYPKYLLKAWDQYHKATGSENDRPDLFGEEQLFLVLEFEFGGNDLENLRNRLPSVLSAKSILQQVTASLAVAEQELHFEHRDLHWGNVLVKKTSEKELSFVLNGATHAIPTNGIHVNIIDYTLSRLEKDGLTVFCDLSTEEELFEGTGDYQFDIYRQMKAENSNVWTDYHPHSNVLWLHYLSDKLLKRMCYKNKSTTAILKKTKCQLFKFHKEVLTFESATDILLNSCLFQ